MHLMAKADFGRAIGKSRQLINELTKKGGMLEGAVVSGKVDVDNPLVAKYCSDRNIVPNFNDVSSPKIGRPARDKVREMRESDDGLPHGDMDVSDFESWTFKEVCETFATDERFKKWLDGRMVLTNIKEKEFKMEIAAGKLVKRSVVKTQVIDHVVSAVTQILTDGSKKIAVESRILAKSGATDRDIEELVVDVIGSYINPMKERIRRGLEKA